MRPAALAAATCLSASLFTGAAAQSVQVGECDWLASMLNIVEPWEANSRSFYEGQVRVVLADSVEPACCWAHLVILMPNPSDEMGLRQCVVVNMGGGMGFAGLDFAQLSATYDPAEGLLVSFPYALYEPETGGIGPWQGARVLLNLETGEAALR